MAGPGAELRGLVVCQWPDDCDSQVFSERKQVMVVLQQDHRFLRHFALGLQTLRCENVGFLAVRISIGMFKQPCLELHAQHAPYSFIDNTLGSLPDLTRSGMYLT